MAVASDLVATHYLLTASTIKAGRERIFRLYESCSAVVIAQKKSLLCPAKIELKSVYPDSGCNQG